MDINGNLKIRLAPTASNITSYTVLGVNNATNEVTQINSSVFSSSATNTTIYAAKKTSGMSLINLSIINPNGFRTVQFNNSSDRQIGNAALFDATTHEYIIPSDGVYEIYYNFRLGSGVEVLVLANTPSAAIARNRANVYSLLDSRSFDGVNAVLASTLNTTATINSFYQFLAGDRISFGSIGGSLANIGILEGQGLASFSIKKISN
jgi:hypothetical protein